METEERIYEDDYSKTFAGQDEFLAFLREREDNSAWKRHEAKELEFHAMNDADYLLSADNNVYTNTCKTANYNTQDKWADGAIPINYELQVRHYMAVMDINTAFCACLFSNNDRFVRESHEHEQLRRLP